MKIAMIGCGNMGSAFAKRLSQFHDIYLYDRHPEKLKILTAEGFGKAFSKIQEILSHVDIVILAIKPQNLKEIAEEMANILKPTQYVISLLSGITMSTLKTYFPKNRIVRMMPNLAITYGNGIASLSADNTISEKERETMTGMFAPLGHIYWIPEEKKDALTALAGSGPAFVLAMIESMVEAGIMMGFSATESQKLVSQMIQGTLSLLDHSHKHPAELKWQITSPRGTTIAGLKKFEENAVGGNIMNTFLAAFERAQTQAIVF